MDGLLTEVASLASAISPGRVSARAVRRAVEVVRSTEASATTGRAPARCTRCGSLEHTRRTCSSEPATPTTAHARRLDREARRAAGDPDAEVFGVELPDSTGSRSRARAQCRCPGEGEGEDAVAEVGRWIRYGCGQHPDARAARRGRELLEHGRVRP